MNEEPARVRRVEVLVPPLVTFAGVSALLLVARFYDRLPLRVPPCGFRSAFGIPCVGCGGTRAMKSLASGRFLEAVSYNPAVVLGISASVLWVLAGILAYRRGRGPLPVSEQNRRIQRAAWITLALLVLNWVYLVLFSP